MAVQTLTAKAETETDATKVTTDTVAAGRADVAAQEPPPTTPAQRLATTAQPVDHLARATATRTGAVLG
jgi:hypothetical protein